MSMMAAHVTQHKKTRSLVMGACAALVFIAALKAHAAAGPTVAEAGRAIAEALLQGGKKASESLGRRDGFMKNPRAHIPVPAGLARPAGVLRRMGRGKIVQDFELSLNRAAESAMPLVMSVFTDVVRQMTIEDGLKIVRGSDDAATRYFRSKSFTVLYRRFMPVVSREMNKVGVTRQYKQLIVSVPSLPGLYDPSQVDLDAYVTRRALDALFIMLAEEERRIRQNPAARTTDLLKKVFGLG